MELMLGNMALRDSWNWSITLCIIFVVAARQLSSYTHVYSHMNYPYGMGVPSLDSSRS